jgi:hypothetical protein
MASRGSNRYEGGRIVAYPGISSTAGRQGRWRDRLTRIMGCTLLVLGATGAHGAGSAGSAEVRLIRGWPDHIILETGAADFSVESVLIEGKKYAQIALGRESRMKTVGAPELPNICRSLLIPDDAQMAVRVVASEHYDIENIDVAPSKGFISRSVNPKDVAYTFGEAYQTDAFYPGEVASLRAPYILRDHRGTVIELNPFQYNPVQRVLRVYTSVTVEVTSIGPGQVNVLERPARPRSLSRSFDQIYSRQFINYPATRYTGLDEEGDLLIIANDPWIPYLGPLETHKEQRGIDTTIVGVSTIGNSPTSIKAYIQNVYDTSDLAFVLLVGDAAEVTSPSVTVGWETESADPTYALVAGGDHYPDILIGRFSAQTSAQVETQVERTIAYEQMPATAQDWFKRASGIGSNEGPGDDGEYDYEHLENIRQDLLAYGYTIVDQIYDPGASASTVSLALNEGRGLVNYTGHGNPYGWGTTGFSNSHINALTNVGMLPFIFSVACNNGTFDGYTCFAETWLRATSGGEPTGAVAVYASSVSQHWEPPMCAQDEFVDLLVAEAYTTLGALWFAGSCQMMDEYGIGGREMYDTWHIFGDPSLHVGGCPEAGTLALDRQAYASEAEVTVTVVDCGLDTDGTIVDSTSVTVDSDSEPAGESILLTETGPATATFTGTIVLSETDTAGVLHVAHGDVVTATYIDANDGAGGVDVEVTATALVDALPPQISNVQTADVGPIQATVTFQADEPALGIVHYGTACGVPIGQAETGDYDTSVTVTVTGLSEDTTYYYTVEAADQAGNTATDDNDGQCYSFATTDVPDFFTELFTGDNDLDNLSITLTPNGSTDQYSSCTETITELPTNPDGGSALSLSDDDWTVVSIPDGRTVQLYGTAYTSFYVCSNGSITFGTGDLEYHESLERHFLLPRIAGLFDDLNPTTGTGQILWEALDDRIAVTWLDIREYGVETTNTFQIELYDDGKLRLSYLGISAADGLAGLSAGTGVDPSFIESNLSAYGDCTVDCNENQIPDDQDIAEGTSQDCNTNGVPDECEEDCNETGVPDDCDITTGTSLDCNANGIPDECDIAGGGSPDDNANGIPDECECLVAEPAQPEPLAMTKNRYISFMPAGAGRQTALRLRFVNLPAPFDVLDGTTMWVGEPLVISENAATLDPAEAPDWPTVVVAPLTCDPFYRDWTTLGTVHVYGEYVVPGGAYEVQAITEGCHLGIEEGYSTALAVTTSAWGDSVGNCATVPCTPPDGLVGIGTDVTAAVDKFKNLPGCMSKIRADVEPALVDRRVNITDITFGVEAFLGHSYPFPGPGSADPCFKVGEEEPGTVAPPELRVREPKRPQTNRER